MAEYNFSLDDIIRRKGTGGRGRGRFQGRGSFNQVNRGSYNQGKRGSYNQGNRGFSNQRNLTSPNQGRIVKPTININNGRNFGGKSFQQNRPGIITDARQKIIQKKLIQFPDARDKLSQLAKTGDARDKLDKIRLKKMGLPLMSPKPLGLLGGRLGTLNTINKKPILLGGRLGDLDLSPENNDWDMDLDMDPPSNISGGMLLQRTVNNSNAMFEQSGLMSRSNRFVVDNTLRSMQSQPAGIGRSITNNVFSLNNSPLNSQLSRTVGGGGGNRRMVLQSAGQKMEQEIRRTATPFAMPISGSKVIVSNLQSCVSQEDITELFADIGPLVKAELVAEGMAEVTFKNTKDAKAAVNAYHKRKLDGCPMFCILQDTQPTPPSSSCLRASSGATIRLPPGGRSSVIPDIATIHKALFQQKNNNNINK